MYLTNFIHKTVNGLKSLLDEKGAIQLFCSEGDIMEFLVTFSQDKATLNDIQSFRRNTSLPFQMIIRSLLHCIMVRKFFRYLLMGRI